MSLERRIQSRVDERESSTSSFLSLSFTRFAGYWIGVGSRLSSVIGREGDLPEEQEELAPGPKASEKTKEKKKAEGGEEDQSGEDDDDEEEYSSSEDEDGPVEGLDKIKAGFMEECKLVSSRFWA